MRRFIAGLVIVVGFGFASAMPSEDPDGIEAVMFDGDKVRTEPLIKGIEMPVPAIGQVVIYIL